jgi:poly-beta-1,6-N-acetyl-D-glucosamine synthase
MRLTYTVITPARDEADNLPALAHALGQQRIRPLRWMIVDGGSSDETVRVAESIVAEYDWARLIVLPTAQRERGAPIVRAIHAGLDALDVESDVVVNVDADVTIEPDYFERLLHEFADDPSLGIASGSAWELEGNVWRQRFVTGGTVWGATRAYRWACLQDVLPLEERHGWDGIDQLKARAQGWETTTFTDLPFRHHRAEGQHDGSTWAHWLANGDTAYFMGYRPWYLFARTAHHLRRDPSALALLFGYASAALRRSPRLEDSPARAVLRTDQSFRNLLHRRREALGLLETSEGIGGRGWARAPAASGATDPHERRDAGRTPSAASRQARLGPGDRRRLPMLSSYAWHTLHPRFISADSVVVDLGANEGHFSQAIVGEFGSACHAVEPDPAVFSRIPADDRITKYCLAIGGTEGRVRFAVAESSLASRVVEHADGSAQTIEVDQLTLPGFVGRFQIPGIDVLKLDIEGAEIAALDACEDDLLRAIKQITIEIHDFCGIVPPSDAERVLARLERLGFSCVRMSRVGHQDTWCVNRRLCRISVLELAFIRLFVRYYWGAFRVLKRRLGLAMTERPLDFRRLSREHR